MDNFIKEFQNKNAAEIERLIKQASASLNKEQQAWLAGYAAGVAASGQDLVKALQSVGSAFGASVAGGTSSGEALLLYSSHSGNGKGLSKLVKKAADAMGVPLRVQDMGEYNLRDLNKEKKLLVIISTHGEGIPPPTAEPLFELLASNRAPKLDGLQYSVLALGDKSYVHFCKAGADVDARFAELGGKRLFERIDCDVDFAEPSQKWAMGVLAELKKTASAGPVQTTTVSQPVVSVASDMTSSVPGYSAKNPFQAAVLSKINLNGRGSEKETYHVELSLEGSGITYQPGDACGLIAENSEKFVADVIAKLGLNGSETIASKDNKPLAEVLKDYELTVLTPEVLKRHNSFADNAKLRETINDVAHLREYIYGRDFIDLLHEYPVKYSAADLLTVLRPIPARLYSIASSPSAYKDEVHLLVSAVRYNALGRNKEGVASTFWADRIRENEKVLVYIKTNEAFRLPHDGAAPVIMVGPGTGLAPFRAFVEERAAQGQKGKSWLFFGNPHFTTDFLYQAEWQEHLKQGKLTRMNVAFSRDQEDKLYVQHRILENAAEVYNWINEGAYIYVCGDVKRMSPDVNNAFVQVVETQAKLEHDKAVEFIKNLKRTGRYLEDVY